jgi:hypothetical protein
MKPSILVFAAIGSLEGFIEVITPDAKSILDVFSAGAIAEGVGSALEKIRDINFYP